MAHTHHHNAIRVHGGQSRGALHEVQDVVHFVAKHVHGSLGRAGLAALSPVRGQGRHVAVFHKGLRVVCVKTREPAKSGVVEHGQGIRPRAVR